jgi:NADPH:quinone reductase-like Zn-dependent oxidoreductase
MRAVLRAGFGGPEQLVIREIPEPEPGAGHAVIAVKAFGINPAEMHMREAHRVMEANEANGKMVVVL